MSKREAITNMLGFTAIAVVATLFWDTFKSPVYFFLTLGILVAIHEWGHFIAAKAVGVRVYEFALGFGPKLVTYMRRGGTEYTIRALPLGGFVNPKGMQPDDPITPDGINGRRPAERALVYLAGPLMNVILGVTVLMLTGALFGVPNDDVALVGQVKKGEPASRMPVVSVDGQPVSNHRERGLKVGDRLLAVNGKPVPGWQSVSTLIHPLAGKPITLRVQRGDRELELQGTPQRTRLPGTFLTLVSAPPKGSGLEGLRPGDQLVGVDGRTLGSFKTEEAIQAYLREKTGEPLRLTVWRVDKPLVIEGKGAPLTFEARPGERWAGTLGFQPFPGAGPRVSLGESFQLGANALQNFTTQLGGMFAPNRIKQIGDNVGGPIAIWVMLADIAKLPLANYFAFLASLSLSLAIFNLVPLPVLDGGHLLLLAVEVLRRRRLEPEVQKLAMLVGFAIVGVLFVLIMSNDILRQFG